MSARFPLLPRVLQQLRRLPMLPGSASAPAPVATVLPLPAPAPAYAWSQSADALAVFSINTWVHAAVSRIASTAVRSTLRVYRRTASGVEELPRHPLLQLLRAPQHGTTQRQWLYQLLQHLLLTGEAHYRIFSHGSGRPQQLLHLPTSGVVLQADALGRPQQVWWQAAGTRHDVPLDEWLYIRLPDPANPGRGISPLRAAGIAVETDEQAQAFAREYFRHGAMPGGILKTDQRMTEEDVARLQQQWHSRYSGASSAGRPLILGQGLSYERIADPFSATAHTQVADACMQRVLAAFGVSKAMLGVVDGVTYSNAQTMDAVFVRYVVMPLLEMVADSLTAVLAPRFAPGDDVYLSFDDLTPRNATEHAQYLQTARGFLTVDELREIEGYSPLGNKATAEAAATTVAPGEAGDSAAAIPSMAAPVSSPFNIPLESIIAPASASVDTLPLV